MGPTLENEGPLKIATATLEDYSEDDDDDDPMKDWAAKGSPLPRRILRERAGGKERADDEESGDADHEAQATGGSAPPLEATPSAGQGGRS